MAKLVERTVQEVANAYLEKYYKSKAKRGKLFAKIEVGTKKGKRADGLIAYRRKLTGKTIVASMESKSYKYQKSITPYRDNKLWRKNSLWTGLYIALGSGIVFAIQNFDSPLWSIVFPISAWLFFSIVVALFTMNKDFNKSMDVLSQINQYPANEQWFSTSLDSYQDVPLHLQDAFKSVVKARGIGLLLVDKRKKVHLIHKPKYRWSLFILGDYLKYYSKEKEIRKQIK